MRKAATGVAILVALWTLLAGCGKKKEDLVLARVGGREITVRDLQGFTAALPQLQRSKKTGLEGHKDHLQTLIDKELLILEARTRGLDKTQRFRERMEAERKRRVLAEFERREISDKIVVTEEEIRRYFAEKNLDREIRANRIVVETEEEAQAVLDEIKKGRSFEEVARERSIDQRTREKGGDLGQFYRKEQVFGPVAEKVFSVEVGGISEPVKTPEGYEIAKITDERPVDFEEFRGKIQARLRSQKFSTRKAEFIEELEERFRLKLNQKGLALLLKRGSSEEEGLPELSESERGISLYEYDGGRITLGSFLDALGRARRSTLSDSAQVIGFARGRLVPDALLWEGTRRAKIEKDRMIISWLKRREEEFLLDELRRVEVANKVEITEDEIRREYVDHIERYSYRPEVWVREILVETEDESNRLLREIQRGTDLGELAEEHTIRWVGRMDKGKFHMHPFEKAIYGNLVEEAFQTEVGQLRGPVEVRGGYSIFKVLEKLDKRPKPFEEARRQTMAVIRYGKEAGLFREFVSQLREKYASQIVIFEDNLKVAFADERQGT